MKLYELGNDKRFTLTDDAAAKVSYEMADAMIKAREVGDE
jgi:hypothetical protein